MKIRFESPGDPRASTIETNHVVEVTEAFNGVMFRTDDGEAIGVCMRDSGFEILYYGPGTSPLLGPDEASAWVEMKDGRVTVHTNLGEVHEIDGIA